MFTITAIGASILIGCSLLGNAKGTMYAISAIITIGGITWICKKISASMNKDYGDWIRFVGNSAMAIPVISILKYAKAGFNVDAMMKMVEDVQKIAGSVGKFAQWIDKTTFWN